MTRERSETRPDFWPFEEPLDHQAIVEKARQIHDSGHSWPYSVAKALSIIRINPTVSQMSAFDKNYNKRLTILVSYECLLWNIEWAESIIADGVTSNSTILNITKQLPPVRQAETFLFELKTQQEREKLIKQDNSGFTLLETIVWQTTQQTTEHSQRIRRLIENGTINNPDDLVKPSVQMKLTDQIIGYAQALADYKKIFNLVSASQH